MIKRRKMRILLKGGLGSGNWNWSTSGPRSGRGGSLSGGGLHTIGLQPGAATEEKMQAINDNSHVKSPLTVEEVGTLIAIWQNPTGYKDGPSTDVLNVEGFHISDADRQIAKGYDLLMQRGLVAEEPNGETSRYRLTENGQAALLERTEKEASREELKKAREKRAEKYGIASKEGGRLQPPADYPSDESSYADPVNYSFPADKAHAKAALGYFNHEGQREKGSYSSAEWKIMGERLATLCTENMAAEYEYKDGKLQQKAEQKEKEFSITDGKWTMGDEDNGLAVRGAELDGEEEYFLYDGENLPPGRYVYLRWKQGGEVPDETAYSPKMVSMVEFLESQLHAVLTLLADRMFATGKIDRETRLILSHAVGEALDKFHTILEDVPDKLNEDYIEYVLGTFPLTKQAKSALTKLVMEEGEYLLKAQDETPYVMTAKAVQSGWLPPIGVPALPRIAKELPKEMWYWEDVGLDERLQRRMAALAYLENE